MNPHLDFLLSSVYERSDLHAEHLADLRKSGLTDATIAMQKIRTVPPPMIGQLLGFQAPKVMHAYVIPYADPHGGWMDHVRLKVFPAYQDRPGRTVKYLGPRGAPPRLFFPVVTPALADTVVPIYLVEGAKKALAVSQLGLAAIGFEGIEGWHRTGSTDLVGDFALINMNGRVVELLPDGDVSTNVNVARGARRLADALRARGARPRLVRLPGDRMTTKVGPDDYIKVTGATAADFESLPREEIGTRRGAPRDAGSRDRGGGGRVDALSRALPIIEVNNRKLSAITADTLKAIALGNQDKLRFFQQDGAIIRLSLDGNGRRRADILTADSARHDFDEVADFISTSARGQRVVFPQVAVVKSVLLRPAYSLPRLRGVAGSPFFTRTGRLVAEAGYHADAELYLDLPAGFTMPTVSPEPTADEVARARELILEPFHDFPFENEASRAHAVALVLAPFSRDLVVGSTPLFGIDATKWGSGKGKLMTVASVIASGEPPSNTPMGGNDEELRKRLTATLLNPQPYIVLDNVRRRIDGESLALLLTTTIWHDRILGVSKMARIPVRAVTVVTGNNLRFSGEMARRDVSIRIVPRMEKPWERNDFKHPDLVEWVQVHRADLVWAALTLVQHWVAKGRVPFTERTKGSFESWAQVTGGILRDARIEGFLENEDTLYTRADAEAAEWNAIVAAWWDKYKDEAVMVEDLLSIVNDVAPGVLGDGGDRSQRTKLGVALSAREEAVFPGDIAIKRVPVTNAKGKARNGYQLVHVAEQEKAPNGAQRTHESPQSAGKVGGVGESEDRMPDSVVTTNSCGTQPNVPTSTNLGQENGKVGDLTQAAVSGSYVRPTNLPTSLSGFAPTQEAHDRIQLDLTRGQTVEHAHMTTDKEDRAGGADDEVVL